MPIFLLAAAAALSSCLAPNRPVPTSTPLPLPTATQPSVADTATQAAPATLAPSEAAAPTQAPSNTPATAAASPTPLAVLATATAAAAATPDPNEAVGDVVYQDRLDGNSGWFWTFSDDVASFGVADGKLKATMKAANSGWRFTIGPEKVHLGAQQVRVSAHTVSCGPNDEYGVMLRLKPDASNLGFDGYLFKLRCGGAASFARVALTTTTSIVDWTPSPAIKTGAPADNTLLVWTAGSEFRLYVNDQYLFSAQDSTLDAGFYGLYLDDRTAGGETVIFDTLGARTVNK